MGAPSGPGKEEAEEAREVREKPGVGTARFLGFWVPTALALGYLLILYVERSRATYTSGYEALGVLFAIPIAFVAGLLYMGIGAAMAGDAVIRKAFVSSSAAALGVVFLLLTIGCFVIYA